MVGQDIERHSRFRRCELFPAFIRLPGLYGRSVLSRAFTFQYRQGTRAKPVVDCRSICVLRPVQVRRRMRLTGCRKLSEFQIASRLADRSGCNIVAFGPCVGSNGTVVAYLCGLENLALHSVSCISGT